MEYIVSTKYDGKPRRLYPERCPVCFEIHYLPKHLLNKGRACSTKCRGIRQSKSVEIICDFCGEKFKCAPSRLKISQSGFHFCSRECKDSAQSLDSGAEFENMRPDHYQTGHTRYRQKARKFQPRVCCKCGYDKYSQILQVHHKDKNRSNSSLDNLETVCPNCHKLIHLGLLV